MGKAIRNTHIRFDDEGEVLPVAKKTRAKKSNVIPDKKQRAFAKAMGFSKVMMANLKTPAKRKPRVISPEKLME